MATLRLALHRGTLVAIAVWSLLMLVMEMFKGGGVGNPRLCATDPRCGDVASWMPTAAWVGGTLLILVIGYGLRPANGPATTTKDKVIGFAVAVGVLVLVGVALTLYHDSRPIA
jgi:hypothetical protein